MSDSDEPIYEFVKGQGWVPRAPKAMPRPGAWITNEVLLEFANPEPEPTLDFEYSYAYAYSQRDRYRYRLERRTPISPEEFERRVEIVRHGVHDDYDLRYRCRDGTLLGYSVRGDSDQYVDYDHYQAGLRSLYRAAEEHGF